MSVRNHPHWLTLVRWAEEAKLRSDNPPTVARFIEDKIDGPKELRAAICMELIKYLNEQERLRGDRPIIFTP